MKTKTLFTSIAQELLDSASQAQSFGAANAPAAQARAAPPVKTGRIVDAQAVQITFPASGQGQAVDGLIGATAGAKVGQVASREMRDAQQAIVQSDNGEPVTVIQEPEAAVQEFGRKEFLISQLPTLRVVPTR